MYMHVYVNVFLKVLEEYTLTYDSGSFAKGNYENVTQEAYLCYCDFLILYTFLYFFPKKIH